MQISAQPREKTGKRAKSLRQQRELPGVIFGKHLQSINVTVDYEAFNKVFTAVGETALVDLTLDGQNQSVLIKDVQHDPVTGKFIHTGFYKVNLLEKITAEIPVEILGEELNVLLKSGEGVLLTLLDTIEVECLPADLPPHFDVDVSALTEVGQGVTVGELKYNKDKVKVKAEEDELVVKIDYPQMQEVEEEAVVTEAEALENIEATKEKPATEEDAEVGSTRDNPKK